MTSIESASCGAPLVAELVLVGRLLPSLSDSSGARAFDVRGIR